MHSSHSICIQSVYQILFGFKIIEKNKTKYSPKREESKDHRYKVF